MKRGIYFRVLLFAVVAVTLSLGILYIVNYKKDVKIADKFNSFGEEIMIAEDGTKYLVDPNKIVSGGPPKGGIGVDVGIPSIINPNFTSVKEADEWIRDDEFVFVLSYKGVERVYPLQILVFHEIVNDEIKGDPILISYCPLCGSGTAFKRYIFISGESGEKTTTDFGVSGKLYNSNLLMYDRATESYWSQFDGKAIAGELVGQKLEKISIEAVQWGIWKKLHESAQVLNRDNGFERPYGRDPYGRDPYGSYYSSDAILFPVDKKDDKIPYKTFVFGVEVNGKFKAYKESDLLNKGVIEDSLNGVKIKIEKDSSGIVKVINLETNEEIIEDRVFWFVWYAFHPETELYGE